MELRILRENEFGIIYCDEFTGILLVPQNKEEERILQDVLKKGKTFVPTIFSTYGYDERIIPKKEPIRGLECVLTKTKDRIHTFNCPHVYLETYSSKEHKNGVVYQINAHTKLGSLTVIFVYHNMSCPVCIRNNCSSGQRNWDNNPKWFADYINPPLKIFQELTNEVNQPNLRELANKWRKERKIELARRED